MAPSVMAKQNPTDEELDAVLSWQVVVAWAGEGLAEPQRLDWWQTDLIDPQGGGDFLQRLLPKTHQWAALAAVRQAAIQVDRRMRAEIADADAVRTLFFWGFTMDEKLSDRLMVHQRQSAGTPIALPLDLQAPFSASAFAAVGQTPESAEQFQVVPSGRELLGPLPESLALRARNLVVALFPLAERYPMPFYRVEA
jgi:hypothetical protein